MFSERDYDRGKLVQDIAAAIKAGVGFVPLIGSGMSAASGIPSGGDYRAYLFYCLTRVFGDFGIYPVQTALSTEPWDPRTLRWPPFSEVPKVDEIGSCMEAWCERVRKSRRWDAYERSIAQQAAGAVQDWRLTLQLLSRVRITRDAPRRKIRLGATDNRVVDSFFVSLTEGKRPNTAHSLLAHLADVLRVKVVLTTNFDGLIERAFERLDLPVTTFDVHREVGLPHDRLVRARRSVVKLHGGHYGLRADFSLDAHPQRTDVDSFCSYLALYDDGPKGGRQRDLLVMGVSGDEQRTIALISHAMSRFPKLRVYWLCYREDELAGVEKAFGEVISNSEELLGKVELGRHLRVAHAPSLTACLLELYQTIFLCLPPSGVGFSAIWPAPSPPLKRLQGLARPGTPSASTRAFDEVVERLSKAITSAGRHSRQARANANLSGQHRIVLVNSREKTRGASSVISAVFSRLAGRFHAVWLSPRHEFERADLVYQVLEAIAREAGVTHTPPFSLDRDEMNEAEGVPAPLSAHINYLTKRAARRFVVFIGTRDFPEVQRGREQKRAAARELDWLVRWLGSADDVTVVVSSWAWFHKHLRSELQSGGAKFDEYEIQPDLGFAEPKVIVKRLLAAMPPTEPERSRFARFALGLTLFRRPCYFSALHCWGLLPAAPGIRGDNDEDRAKQAAHFLETLRKHDAIRDESGQNVYMYGELRRQFRKRLLYTGAVTPFEHSEVHQGIADWYLKLYRSSGDVHAVLESMYHRIQSIRVARVEPVAHARARGAAFFTESQQSELRVALELARQAVLPSTRQLTLVHAWEELVADARQVTRHVPDLAEFTQELDGVRKKYLEGLGVADRPPRRAAKARWNHQLSPTAEQKLLAAAGQQAAEYDSVRRLLQSRGSQRPVRIQLQASHRLMLQRAYEAAERELAEQLTKLGVPTQALRHFIRQELPPSQLRTAARLLAHQWRGPLIGDGVLALRRLHQLKLYQAEAVRLAGNAAKADELLTQAERVYTMVSEATRFITDSRALHEESALLRTNAGVLLSWMGRHREAQRRYNEAYGYLSYVGEQTSPLRWATVDLRRAETFLCWLQTTRQSHDFEPFGMLYDAFAAVERAKYKIADAPVNRHWYGWLRELELMVCCEIARLAHKHAGADQRFSRCRDRETLAGWFYDRFEQTWHCVRQDPLRLARYIDLSIDFLIFRGQIQEEGVHTRAIVQTALSARAQLELLSKKRSNPTVSADVREYVKRVLRRARELPLIVPDPPDDTSPETASAAELRSAPAKRDARTSVPPRSTRRRTRSRSVPTRRTARAI